MNPEIKAARPRPRAGRDSATGELDPGRKDTRSSWSTSAALVIPPVALTIVLSICAVAFFALPAIETNMMTSKRDMLRELVSTTWGLLDHYDRQAQHGLLTREQAQAQAIEQIRALRYGPQGKDYFWINDMQPRMIVHPYRPDLEGQDVSDLVDSHGKRIFEAFVNAARGHNGGFVDYMWQWEDKPDRIVPKLSYVRRFAPWDWIIGTGIYLEDVQREIAAVTGRIQRAFAGIIAVILVLSLLIIWQAQRIDRQRMRAEEDLRRSQITLTQAQRMARLGTWEWDRRQGRIEWSAEMYDIFGLDPGEFRPTAESVRRVLCHDEWHAYRRTVVRGLASHSPTTFEQRISRPDGSIRHLTCTFQGFYDHGGTPRRILGMVQDVTEQKIAEQERITRLERTRRGQAILLRLATDEAIAGGDLPAALHRITETAADALEVGRAGVWLFDDSGQQLCCKDLFSRSSRSHSSDLTLAADQYPRYFAALREGRFVDAHDARTDPRTEEFTQTYLEPFRITAMLDAAIRVSGTLAGVLCFEHVSTPHRWRADEITLAAAIADQVAQAMVNAERRRDAEANRGTAQRLAALIEHTPLGVIEWNLDFRVVRWNSAAEHIFGYARSEVLGRHAFDLIVPEEAREHVADVWRKLLEEPGGGRSTNPNHTKTGEWLACEWYNTTLLDQNGKVIGVASLVQDVTDRERAQETLRASEARYRRAIAASDAVAYQRDYATNEFTYIGKEIERFTGYRAKEITAEVWQTLVVEGVMHGEAAGLSLDEAVRKARRGGIREWRADYRLRARDGRERWLADSSIQLVDETGRAVGSLGILQDITDRRQLEEQLLQAQKMEAVGRLAGGVAHDFNNILTAVLGHVELADAELRDENPRLERVEHDLHEIQKSAERAASLTRQLLAFSRRSLARPRVLDLNRTIKEMEGMLHRLLTESIVLESQLADDLSPVRVDKGHIEQVVLNLAVNGGDAMPGGGRLTIETTNICLDPSYTATHAEARPGPHVMLAVSDTGDGIPKASIPHIFEPFFTTKSVGRGTGLGLSTVYGIVKQAGGHVTVYSEEGHGTTFKVYLPAALSAEPAPPTHNPTTDVIPTGTETVLVCEDDTSVRQLAETILVAAGYTVLAAPGGRDALELARTHDGTINLLITDVIMPDMNGRQLADALDALRPGIATLFVSGYAANVIAHHGILHEDIEFLEKPFNRRTLALRVREVLDSPGAS